MNYVMNHGKMALYLVVTKIFDNRAAEQMARCTFTKLWKPCETEDMKCSLEWEHSSLLSQVENSTHHNIYYNIRWRRFLEGFFFFF